MSTSTPSLWLIGAGSMAIEYARVLSALDQLFEVVSRGRHSAEIFENSTGHSARAGGLLPALMSLGVPSTAIVVVNVEQLALVTETLIRAGTKRILLEKPGGVDLSEITALNLLAEEFDVEILVAYNRRFYDSVERLRQYVLEDGGVLSMSFEFTEWSHKIRELEKDSAVKENWLLSNSTHVIDLAFHLCGPPVDWQCWHAGSLDWHPAAARFCGAGITDKGVMFSYLSDWESPGRWGLELMTARRRLILRPMEDLQFIPLGSVSMEHTIPNSQLDKDFKPGLFKLVDAFLRGDDIYLCKLTDQVVNAEIFSRMAGY